MPDDQGAGDEITGEEPEQPPVLAEPTTDEAVGELPKLPSIVSPDFNESESAYKRAKDAERNRETRPPDDESVTFRSVTLAEAYVGRQADSLTAALRKINWVDIDTTIADEIDKGRREGGYATNDFTLFSRSGVRESLFGYGEIDLPSGFRRIYGRYYVLGPSVVALVLTFVLAEDLVRCLDAALRKDVERRVRQELPNMAGTEISGSAHDSQWPSCADVFAGQLC